MTRIRTLIFHPALAPYRLDLFNELSRRMETKVVFFRENLVTQKFDQRRLLSQLHCDYEYLCSGIDILGRQLRWGIARAISRFKPDVVVVMEYAPSTLIASLVKLCSPHCSWKLIVWTADNIHMCREINPLRRLARKAALSLADGMIVYSQPVKNWYTDYGIPSQAIGVCSNIQSETRFRDSLEKTRQIAQQWIDRYNLRHKQLILSVGRLVKVKGVDRVIQAFAPACRLFPDALLIIVGDGPEKEFLQALVARLNITEKIKFVGRLEGPELLAWYYLAGLFVLASHFEPYGAVVNEAALSGIPVLCSTRAGAADLIRTGHNGSTFDPDNLAELTEHLTNYLERMPLLRPNQIHLRDSLMPITFQDGVREFVRTVAYTAAS